jgi:hypothetical protein
MIRLVLPLVTLATMGCTLDARPQAASPAGTGTCTDKGLDRLIGKKRSDKVAGEARRLSGAKLLRWIAPGMMVTMDYREDRLNLQLGTDGRIASAHCG